MSKMAKQVKEVKTAKNEKSVENFMGGISYELNPLDTLKMVSASSIFGEPQYYRDGEFAEKSIHEDGEYRVDDLFADYAILALDKYKGKKTSEVMEIVIDAALKYDFKATLEWAKILRKEYLMRLNPQIIMVRAAMMTEERIAFTNENPGLFAGINMDVMQRGDDVTAQITYYIFRNEDKNNIPGILKKSWAKKINSLSRYELAKYKNANIGLINAIRICHAHNSNIDELIKTGTIEMPDNNKTWEALRASGMSWKEILDTIKMNHMALLRNLRGIFSEIDDIETCNKIMDELKNGVKNGKQFPFRYMSARKAVLGAKDKIGDNITTITDSLEDCLDISCDNLPMLKGNNAFLSDNSGSAWGTLTSEYGTVTVAEIDNLSSVIGAANSERGTVIKFGDKMKKYPISKREGILKQASEISKDNGYDVGASTENGVWLFFDEAITKKIHYDNIFIYSDMQAGHGGLYGTHEGKKKYMTEGYACKGQYIDVAKLIDAYRKKVNPKVNVYCIQTAGYDNVLVPENGYRTNILYGWTGKELVYAKMMNDFWDEKDAEKEKKNKGE